MCRKIGAGLSGPGKQGPEKELCEIWTRKKVPGDTNTATREVEWRDGGCLDALALPLTLVDVLKRTSPTEFHADPELLQPTAVQE